jgi:hypothetical protein
VIVAAVAFESDRPLTCGDGIVPSLKLQREPAKQLLTFRILAARRGDRLQKFKRVIGAALLKIADHVCAPPWSESQQVGRDQQNDQQKYGGSTHETLSDT